MKPILRTVLFIIVALTAVDSRPQDKAGVQVPDATAALRIAEPILIRTYGESHIDDERPLKAKLDGGVWSVFGTLCCPDGAGHRTCEQGRCLGGVAVLKLRQSDGKILSITHGK
jgi:hypothetical protein